MPLPNIINGHSKQCAARAKHSGMRCLNLCAYDSRVCRFHGARKKATILRGPEHPNYKHGRETKEAKKKRSLGLHRLRALEELLANIPLFGYPHPKGRKPKI
jgi:hypothetical protein